MRKHEILLRKCSDGAAQLRTWEGTLAAMASRLDGLPGCSPPWKAKDSAKLAWSLDLLTKFHNTIICSTSDAILARRFLGIQQNQCFALFQRRHLCDDVFSQGCGSGYFVNRFRFQQNLDSNRAWALSHLWTCWQAWLSKPAAYDLQGHITSSNDRIS